MRERLLPATTALHMEICVCVCVWRERVRYSAIKEEKEGRDEEERGREEEEREDDERRVAHLLTCLASLVASSSVLNRKDHACRWSS